jgi:hypothetical protein
MLSDANFFHSHLSSSITSIILNSLCELETKKIVSNTPTQFKNP